MMKKLSGLILLPSLVFLAACGDEVTQINQTGIEAVDAEDDLPKCTKDNENELVFVKDDLTARICTDGEWVAMKGNSTCTTEELKDKSGYKIVCDGDSIGVVLNGEKGESGKDGKNGSDGEDGKAGTGCAMTEKTESTVTVVCGDSTIVIELGVDANGDTLELDSEKVVVSLDSVAGYSQKGPFLKGSTVYLYELSDGRTLKQTNGNFTSYITRDDGRYKFSARDLASQYAMIVVEGNYRNEVTGKPSDAPIRLRAITDMRKRSDANINLLTTLEFDRVYYLVTREHKTVKQAKKQAQTEIFNAFHIDITGFTGSAEDLDVFGETDADAALLAISILAQRDSNETALSVLLTEISNDIESDGTWDDSTTRAQIADWAATADSTISDSASRLATFRNNVEGWGLGSGNVPSFEKFVRRFWSTELGLGVCGDSKNPVGTVKQVTNERSDRYYASSYIAVDNKVRFICDGASLPRWRNAKDIEKDTMGWGHEFTEGDVKNGRVNSGLTYVYQNNSWRLGANADSLIGKGCVSWREDTVAQGSNKSWYKCVSNAWRIATNIEKDTATWGHDFTEGDVKNGNVNSGLTYVYENNNWRLGTDLDSLLYKAGGKGCVKNDDTSTVKYNDRYYVCTAQSGSVPHKWVVARALYNDTYESRDSCVEGGKYSDGRILAGRVNANNKYVCDNGEFRAAETLEIKGGKGCTSYNSKELYVLKHQYSYYKCTETGWELTLEKLNIDSISYGGQTYKTIGIKTQNWMAENLNYEVEGQSFCYENSADSCAKYGRLYTWAAAMDSAGTWSSNGKGCGYDLKCSPTYPVRGVCPEGWHMPDIGDWGTLYSAMGGSPYAMQAKGVANWTSATDAYGFSALPAGYYYNGSVKNFGSNAYFWSSTEDSNPYAYARELSADASKSDNHYNKKYGYSVRCIQDKP